MKKFVLLSLILILSSVLFSPVLAAAEFTATDQSLIIFDEDDNGYFFARVENTGDAGGYIGSGTLDILNENDEVIVTKNYVGSNPSSIWLEPGEYAYVDLYLWEKSFLENTVTDYNYTVPVNNWGSEYKMIPCEGDFYFNPDDKYDNAVFVTFTNTGDELLHDFENVVALYDEDGNLIFCDSNMNYDVSIHPGSTITVKVDISSSLVEYLGANGLTPASVEVLTYVEMP